MSFTHPTRVPFFELLLAFVSLLSIAVFAQTGPTPDSGTIDASSAISQPVSLTWTGTAPPGTGGNGACAQQPLAGGVSAGNAIVFHLTLANVPADFYTNYNSRMTVEVTWDPAGGNLSTQDLEVLFDSFSNISDTGSNREVVTVDNLVAGSYDVYVCDILVALPQPFNAKATFEVRPKSNPFPQPSLPPAPLAKVTPPRYQNHTPTQDQVAQGMGKNSSDEPSIGCNWKTGNVFYQGVLQTLRVKFDDSCPQTPSSFWENKSPITSQQTFDPILFTDRETGETIVSQLGFNPIAGLSSVTLDDGETWIPSQGSGIGSGVDHQTVGGGPYHAPVPSNAAFPHAVYYCSQDIALANCALSVDGGITYGPAVPIYALTQCEGLHGHIKVGADGTAYIPNRGCKGTLGLEQAIVLSENNGASWTVRTVPGSVTSGSDPSVAEDKGGRLYLGFVHGHIPGVAVSDDKGVTWKYLYDVGAQLGIKNAAFPAVVAGDKGRAAFAFYGTKAEGNVDSFAFPPNAWHLYVAHTYDGGQSWVTVDATPNDPLQRGGMRLGGGGAIHRNLLDFFDANMDAEGRVLVSYPDGCRGTCAQAADTARGNSYGAFSTIARQSGGPRLIAAFDPPATTVPGAPRLTVTRNGSLTKLTWSQSDTGGLPISGYKIFRRSGSGPEQLLASIGGSATSYVDQSGDPRVTYSYRVVASNSLGESCGSNETVAAPVGSSCAAPGWRVLEDKAGDQTGAPLNADMDIQWISIAEPYFPDGSRKLVFRMKVASLASLQPNRMWRIIWNYPDSPVPPNPDDPGFFIGRYYVGMNTDENGAVSFEYGFAESLSLVLADVQPPFALGVPDDASFTPDGTITITIAADKVGGPKAGDLIGGVVGRTYPVRNDLTLRGNGAADDVSLGNTYMLVGNAFCQNPPPTINCFEDDDTRISYANGWHTASSAAASAGRYHFRPGNDNRTSVSFSFEVAAGASGGVVYHYARSTKGGSADVYIDGVFKETVSYRGTSGTDKDPQFGFSARYTGLAAGSHTFELRNVRGSAFVDRFCLENSFSSSTAATGPGNTTSALSVLDPALQLVQTVQVPAGAQAISVVAESSTGSPVNLVLVDPLGAVAASVSSTSGTAIIERPVTLPGAYVVKAVNAGSTPAEVWLLATPWGTR